MPTFPHFPSRFVRHAYAQPDVSFPWDVFCRLCYLPAEGLQPKKRLTYKRKKTGRALTALVSAETQALIDPRCKLSGGIGLSFPHPGDLRMGERGGI